MGERELEKPLWWVREREGVSEMGELERASEIASVVG
jgi:hypothetical protein